MRKALLMATLALLATPAFCGDAYVLFGLPAGQRPRAYNLSVTIPEGGEVYVVGQQETFVYGGRPLLKNVNVDISRDGGTTWTNIGAIASTHRGPIGGNKFNWTVAGPSSTACVVRFSGTIGKTTVAVNSGTFSIGGASAPPYLFTGPVGSMGANGNDGAQGPIGAQGPQGIQGPVGPAGPKGDAGDAGSMGMPGPIGATGATGPVGPKGATGSNGTNGTNGATGPQGATGPAGAAGPKGDAGAQGPAGPVGATGAVGAKGATGANGTNGATGPQGPAGPAGPQGPQGPSCYAGGCFFGIYVLTNVNCIHDERVTDSRCKPGCIIHVDFDDTDAPCDDAVTYKVRVYNGYFIVHLVCANNFSLRHKFHYHVVCP